MSLEADDLRDDAPHERHVVLNSAAGQYPAASCLNIDNGIHDISLAEGFCDLLVRLSNDPSPGDGLKLDKSSATTLKRPPEQSEPSSLDNTPCLSLDLDCDSGGTTDTPEPLEPGPASEECSGGSLDCNYAWSDICMLFPSVL